MAQRPRDQDIDLESLLTLPATHEEREAQALTLFQTLVTLHGQCARIEFQLANPTMLATTDATWRERATRVLKLKRRQEQAVQQYLHMLQKRLEDDRRLAHTRLHLEQKRMIQQYENHRQAMKYGLFHTICRRMLPPETLEALYQELDRQMAAEEACRGVCHTNGPTEGTE